MQFIEVDGTVPTIRLECTELPKLSSVRPSVTTPGSPLRCFERLQFFQGLVDINEGENRPSVCVGHHCQLEPPGNLTP